MAVQTNKLLTLGGAQILYNDLRGRIVRVNETAQADAGLTVNSGKLCVASTGKPLLTNETALKIRAQLIRHTAILRGSYSGNSVLRYDTAQSFSSTQQNQVRANMGIGNAVGLSYSVVSTW